MKGNLTGLVELQKVDKELQKLEELKGDLPQQIERLRAELNSAKGSYDSRKEEFTEVRKSKAIQEGDLRDLQQKAKKYREQLYSVTSNREYDAITAEIDTVDARISDVEDEILQLIEKEETLEEGLKTAEPEIAALEDNLTTKEIELNQKIQATEKEYDALCKQRGEIAGALQRRVLYQYERIRKGIGNSAVAEIHHGACSECFSSIPPQKRVEIRMMNEMLFCESCGRILVHVQEKEAVTG